MPTQANVGAYGALAALILAGTRPAISQTAPPTSPSPLPTGRTTYRTLNDTYDEIQRLADSLPNQVVRLELPHRSLLGQRVWGLEISHDIKNSAAKPALLITSLHHAREWPTAEIAMEFAHDVLQKDGVDAGITALLDQARVIIVPVVNVDGFDLSRSLLREQKRKNCRAAIDTVSTRAACLDPNDIDPGVDLNRNYGAFWGGAGAAVSSSGTTTRGAAPFSEPEVQNIRDLLWSNQVTVAVDIHTKEKNVARVPFSTDEPVPVDAAPYDSLLQAIGRDLQYPVGTFPALNEGESVTGVMAQTAYYSTGAFGFIIETVPDDSFHPSYAQVIDQYFGTGTYAGSSMRTTLLRLLAAAAEPRLHSVLNVTAPAGATLTIRKEFTLESSPVRDDGGAPGAPVMIPVTVTSSLTVPKGAKRVAWHVNPSTHPSQHAPGLVPGTWTLTCTANGGQSQVIEVTVARGGTADIPMPQCR